MQQTAAQISASGQQQIDLVLGSSRRCLHLGFGCQNQATASLSGTLSGSKLKVQLSLSDGTKVSVTGTVNTDGTISGTYTGGCPSNSQAHSAERTLPAPTAPITAACRMSSVVEYPISLVLTETRTTV